DIESRNAKPAIISDVHPQTPMIVIKNLFLYLNTFLAVTFAVKLNFFHINVIFSNNTLLPGFGDFGLISVAGLCLNTFAHVYIVAPTVHNSAAAIPSVAMSQLNCNITSGTSYTIAYIFAII